ncbi:MAG: cyclodeaminase/cyclohydrolase family protein [Vicinamibacteria bacterium]
MALLDLAARELLDRFASPAPVPGGGSAGALGGALAAALVSMVCALPRTRTGAAEERAELETAGRWAGSAGARLRRLIEDDAAAYEAVLAARRLPRTSDLERGRRATAVGAALARATAVPLETAEACLVVLRAGERALAHGNPNAAADVGTALALAHAALEGAALNVRANADPADPAGALALQRIEALRLEGASGYGTILRTLTPESSGSEPTAT